MLLAVLTVVLTAVLTISVVLQVVLLVVLMVGVGGRAAPRARLASQGTARGPHLAEAPWMRPEPTVPASDSWVRIRVYQVVVMETGEKLIVKHVALKRKACLTNNC